MTAADVTHRARAYAALVDSLSRGTGGETPRSEEAKQRAGVDLFGNARLVRLSRCVVCGALGEPGDDCGRWPVGHRLRMVP